MKKIFLVFIFIFSIFLLNSVNADEAEYWIPSITYNPIDSSKFSSIQKVGEYYEAIIDWKKQNNKYEDYLLFWYWNVNWKFYAQVKENWKWYYIEGWVKSELYDDLSCIYSEWFYCTANIWDTWYLIYNGKVLSWNYDKFDQYNYFSFDTSYKNNWINVKKSWKSILLINWKEKNSWNENEIFSNVFFSLEWKGIIITSYDSVLWINYIYLNWKKIKYVDNIQYYQDNYVFLTEKDGSYFFNSYNLKDNKISTKKINNATYAYWLWTFESEQKVIYYYIKQSKSWLYSIVVNWKESKEYTSLTYVWIIFDESSPYKWYLVYSAIKDWKLYIIVNWKEYKLD